MLLSNNQNTGVTNTVLVTDAKYSTILADVKKINPLPVRTSTVNIFIHLGYICFSTITQIFHEYFGLYLGSAIIERVRNTSFLLSVLSSFLLSFLFPFPLSFPCLAFLWHCYLRMNCTKYTIQYTVNILLLQIHLLKTLYDIQNQ